MNRYVDFLVKILILTTLVTIFMTIPFYMLSETNERFSIYLWGFVFGVFFAWVLDVVNDWYTKVRNKNFPLKVK